MSENNLTLPNSLYVMFRGFAVVVLPLLCILKAS